MFDPARRTSLTRRDHPGERPRASVRAMKCLRAAAIALCAGCAAKEPAVTADLSSLTVVELAAIADAAGNASVVTIGSDGTSGDRVLVVADATLANVRTCATKASPDFLQTPHDRSALTSAGIAYGHRHDGRFDLHFVAPSCDELLEVDDVLAVYEREQPVVLQTLDGVRRLDPELVAAPQISPGTYLGRFSTSLAFREGTNLVLRDSVGKLVATRPAKRVALFPSRLAIESDAGVAVWTASDSAPQPVDAAGCLDDDVDATSTRFVVPVWRSPCTATTLTAFSPDSATTFARVDVGNDAIAIPHWFVPDVLVINGAKDAVRGVATRVGPAATRTKLAEDLLVDAPHVAEANWSSGGPAHYYFVAGDLDAGTARILLLSADGMSFATVSSGVRAIVQWDPIALSIAGLHLRDWDPTKKTGTLVQLQSRTAILAQNVPVDGWSMTAQPSQIGAIVEADASGVGSLRAIDDAKGFASPSTAVMPSARAGLKLPGTSGKWIAVPASGTGLVVVP